MGRYYFDAKTTVEQVTQLSIFKLKEFGLLTDYAATTLSWKWSLSGRKSSIKRQAQIILAVGTVIICLMKAGTNRVLHVPEVSATRLKPKGCMKSFTSRLSAGRGEEDPRRRRGSFKSLSRECQDCLMLMTRF